MIAIQGVTTICEELWMIAVGGVEAIQGELSPIASYEVSLDMIWCILSLYVVSVANEASCVLHTILYIQHLPQPLLNSSCYSTFHSRSSTRAVAGPVEIHAFSTWN
jgi:hypothetical protein